MPTPQHNNPLGTASAAAPRGGCAKGFCLSAVGRTGQAYYATAGRTALCACPARCDRGGWAERELLLAVNLVANGQLLATLGATGSQYAAAISRLHALTETMLVVSLPVVGLECSFHFCILVFVLWLVHDRAFGVLRSSGCKVTKIIPFGETFPVFFCTPFLRLATS